MKKEQHTTEKVLSHKLFLQREYNYSHLSYEKELNFYNAVKSGEAKSGDYFLLDDDGVYIGDPESFDADVLFYAVKIDDVVDFSKVHPEEYISFDKVNINDIVHNFFL